MALPKGLVGMYEEALPTSVNVNERKKFLEFFSIWSLLKKEVSAEFVLSMLEGWTEGQIIEYIAQYSKWFNSPVTGKYVLYHERLRTFILQKVSAHQFEKCNEQIIHQCQLALQYKTGDEWERYALEFLSTHLLIQAMESQVGETLKTLSYNTTHWNRQIEISKGFEWSKRMLNEMMLWASKYDNDEVIECALNKVDLYHLEQNDAPKVVAMVANGEIDLALKRIESFGGFDSIGLQRKFTLYMLCLIELTLLASKKRPFCKSAIDALLKHLVEYLPRDHSTLQWNDFFPSYLMFQMACVWADLGLDYLSVYQRTDDWDNEWILHMGPYTYLNIEVLEGCARGITDDYSKSSALKVIALALSKQGEVQKGLAIARSISHEGLKSCALTDISIAQCEQGQLEESESLVQESLTIALCMKDYEWQGRALKEISLALSYQGRMEESLAIARDIIDKFQKCIALCNIAVSLNKYGHFEDSASVMQESLAITRGMSNSYWQESVLMEIAVALSKQGKVEESLTIAEELCSTDMQGNALKAIALELCNQGQVEEALSIARRISDERYISDKCSALKDIAVALFKQGKVEESASVMQESLSIAQGIMDRQKRIALIDIAVALSKQGQFEKSLAIARSISDAWDKESALKSIAAEMSKQCMLEKSFWVLHETLVIARGISDESRALSDIALQLSSRGLMEESLVFIRSINDSWRKSVALRESSVALSKLGKAEESLAIASEISDEFQKSLALTGIAVLLSQQGQVEEAVLLTQDSLALANRISSEERKSMALNSIAKALSEQGHLEKALALARSFSNEGDRNSALREISQSLSEQGQIDESLSIARGIGDFGERSRALESIVAVQSKQGKIQEALYIAHGISSDFCKFSALGVITVELIKHGKVEESIAIARDMNDDWGMSLVLKDIAVQLSKQCQVEKSLALARSLSDKSSALKDIAVELSKQGAWNLAEKTGLEIPQIGKRHDCWETIAVETVKFSNWEAALESVKRLKSEEAQLYYLKGWASQVVQLDVNNDCLNLALPIISKDAEIIETLLQKYAIREMVLGNPSHEHTERIKQTIDIQWVADVKKNRVK